MQVKLVTLKRQKRTQFITSFAIALQNLEKILGGEHKMNTKTVFFIKKCKQSIKFQHAMHHSETHIVAEIFSSRDSGL